MISSEAETEPTQDRNIYSSHSEQLQFCYEIERYWRAHGYSGMLARPELISFEFPASVSPKGHKRPAAKFRVWVIKSNLDGRGFPPREQG